MLPLHSNSLVFLSYRHLRHLIKAFHRIAGCYIQSRSPRHNIRNKCISKLFHNCSPINTIAWRNKSTHSSLSHFNCIIMSTFSKLDYSSAETTDNQFKFFQFPPFFSPSFSRFALPSHGNGGGRFFTIAAKKYINKSVILSEYNSFQSVLDFIWIGIQNSDEKRHSSITCKKDKSVLAASYPNYSELCCMSTRLINAYKLMHRQKKKEE